MVMALAGSPQWCSAIFPAWLIVRLPGSLLIVTDGNGVSWWRGDVRGGGRDEPGDDGDWPGAVRAGGHCGDGAGAGWCAVATGGGTGVVAGRGGAGQGGG